MQQLQQEIKGAIKNRHQGSSLTDDDIAQLKIIKRWLANKVEKAIEKIKEIESLHQLLVDNVNSVDEQKIILHKIDDLNQEVNDIIGFNQEGDRKRVDGAIDFINDTLLNKDEKSANSLKSIFNKFGLFNLDYNEREKPLPTETGLEMIPEKVSFLSLAKEVLKKADDIFNRVSVLAAKLEDMGLGVSDERGDYKAILDEKEILDNNVAALKDKLEAIKKCYETMTSPACRDKERHELASQLRKLIGEVEVINRAIISSVSKIEDSFKAISSQAKREQEIINESINNSESPYVSSLQRTQDGAEQSYLMGSPDDQVFVALQSQFGLIAENIKNVKEDLSDALELAKINIDNAPEYNSSVEATPTQELKTVEIEDITSQEALQAILAYAEESITVEPEQSKIVDVEVDKLSESNILEVIKELKTMKAMIGGSSIALEHSALYKSMIARLDVAINYLEAEYRGEIKDDNPMENLRQAKAALLYENGVHVNIDKLGDAAGAYFKKMKPEEINQLKQEGVAPEQYRACLAKCGKIVGAYKEKKNNREKMVADVPHAEVTVVPQKARKRKKSKKKRKVNRPVIESSEKEAPPPFERSHYERSKANNNEITVSKISPIGEILEKLRTPSVEKRYMQYKAGKEKNKTSFTRGEEVLFSSIDHLVKLEYAIKQLDERAEHKSPGELFESIEEILTELRYLNANIDNSDLHDLIEDIQKNINAYRQAYLFDAYEQARTLLEDLSNEGKRHELIENAIASITSFDGLSPKEFEEIKQKFINEHRDNSVPKDIQQAGSYFNTDHPPLYTSKVYNDVQRHMKVIANEKKRLDPGKFKQQFQDKLEKVAAKNKIVNSLEALKQESGSLQKIHKDSIEEQKQEDLLRPTSARQSMSNEKYEYFEFQEVVDGWFKDNNAQLEKLNEEINSLLKKANNLDTAEDNFSDRLAEIEEELAYLKDKKAELEKNTAELKDEFKQYIEEKNDLIGVYNSIAQYLDILNKVDNSFEPAVQDEVGELKAIISDLKEDILKRGEPHGYEKKSPDLENLQQRVEKAVDAVQLNSDLIKLNKAKEALKQTVDNIFGNQQNPQGLIFDYRQHDRNDDKYMMEKIRLRFKDFIGKKFPEKTLRDALSSADCKIINAAYKKLHDDLKDIHQKIKHAKSPSEVEKLEAKVVSVQGKAIKLNNIIQDKIRWNIKNPKKVKRSHHFRFSKTEAQLHQDMENVVNQHVRVARSRHYSNPKLNSAEKLNESLGSLSQPVLSSPLRGARRSPVSPPTEPMTTAAREQNLTDMDKHMHSLAEKKANGEIERYEAQTKDGLQHVSVTKNDGTTEEKFFNADGSEYQSSQQLSQGHGNQ